MEENKKWYAIYTKPRWEKKVYTLLTEKKLEAYCPLNKVRKKWSDRIKVVEEPLFKSYVFVRVAEEEQIKVRMVNGVINYIYQEGKPAVIRDREIAVIKKFLNEYDNVQAEPAALHENMKVRVQQGAFMDKEGIVVKIVNNKVQVMLESIGYCLTAVVEKSNLVVTGK